MAERCDACRKRRKVTMHTLGIDLCGPCAARADDPAVQREWCTGRHLCHHWYEDECSSECDRGEHDGGHGHDGCTDRTSPISGTDETP